jgi:hypothetical protein
MAKRVVGEARGRGRLWLEHVQAARARGVSLKGDAEQAGLKVEQLYRWRRRLRADVAVGFVAVQVSEGLCHQRLHCPNGLVLECSGAPDLALIERLRCLGLVGTCCVRARLCHGSVGAASRWTCARACAPWHCWWSRPWGSPPLGRRWRPSAIAAGRTRR